MEHPKPSLIVDDLSVRRGRAEVLHGISFSVPPGKVVALLGSNGAGKSTTLRTISGLLRPANGSITFAGERLDGLSSGQIVRRGISHVPEGRLIFSDLTVLQNLRMGAYVRGRVSKEDLAEVCELFPVLGDLFHRRGGGLSGGQQQMLAIARGLLAKPKVLLLDEPSLGLAPKVIQTIGDVLRRLCEEGLSILLVEQNAELALRLADWGYVLSSGKITVSGEADALLQDDEVRRSYLGI